ncbi:hypothetical protein LG047_17395 [Methylocystis sp. WRRC1]|uniref:hypothetical protein n=1 Tax=Methylocystis sp. WRRC1 TaxID=1732014 RepID=UPI001D15AF1A|nr:hypothetical protein [Methylocystis sp. WRRC1]MCC3247072.1 hypothetical protein [Methylocystis sp. WRRC1]
MSSDTAISDPPTRLKMATAQYRPRDFSHPERVEAFTDFSKTPQARPLERELSIGDRLTEAQAQSLDCPLLHDFGLELRDIRSGAPSYSPKGEREFAGIYEVRPASA